MREAAVGDGAVDDAVAALAGLEQHAAGEPQRSGGGEDRGAPDAAHALRAAHVVEARGVHVQAHIAVRGGDEEVVGPAGNLEMAVGFKLRGRPVISDIVGANHVIAVVNDDLA